MDTARRGLLLLTNVYPFDKGEEFLENEIQALTGAFDTVVVAACQTSDDSVQTRTLPAGVRALRARGRRPSGAQAVLATSRGGLLLLRQRFHPLDGMDPRHAAMDAQFEARAQAVVAELSGQLDQLGLDELGSLVIYAYWLHLPARAGMLLAGQICRQYPRLQQIRLVSRAHRYDLYEDAAPLGHIPLRTTLLDAYDAIHPVSDDGTRHLQQRHPRFAHKVSTRRLGTPDPGELVKTSREPFHVVSCSFVLPVKRVDRFAGVLQLLQEEDIDVKWTHFGSGEDLAQVRARAVELLGAEAVEMPGYVRNTELAQRYREIRPSVFVNLSESEGLPVSIMEAAALGLPVVATDVGGVRELVGSSNGGLLASDFTDRQAAEALLRLARMPEQDYRETCIGSRRLWEQQFAKDVVYPAFAAELAAR